ncbi:MAG: beta-hydroxyacyl-ACP dehydratase [Candidatus Protistobacter heckmanni]|nr:beta-hydroxyacyl-ACP dehydratase [Candidatus Protistobacter heckmanni]
MNGTSGVIPLIEQLLPHRGVMLLLDRVTAFDDVSVTAEYAVRGEAWYGRKMDEGAMMPVWIGVELMAQAIATYVCLLSLSKGAPVRPGVLLRTNRYLCEVAGFAAGSLLRVRARENLRSEEGYGTYDCVIEYGGVESAHTMVKVFQLEDILALMQADAGKGEQT